MGKIISLLIFFIFHDGMLTMLHHNIHSFTLQTTKEIQNKTQHIQVSSDEDMK